MAVEQGVERVKKFFLRAFLAAEELNVVDQQKLSLTIAFAELNQIIVLNRVDKFIDEELTRKVHHLGALLLRPDVLADRLHQVRLAQSYASVNEKRVVGASRRLRDCEACRMRDFIVWTDHKALKRVAGI